MCLFIIQGHGIQHLCSAVRNTRTVNIDLLVLHGQKGIIYLLFYIIIILIIGGSANVVYTRWHSNTVHFIGEQGIGVSICNSWQDHYFLTGLKIKKNTVFILSIIDRFSKMLILGIKT